jgi:hypothetical protein
VLSYNLFYTKYYPLSYPAERDDNFSFPSGGRPGRGFYENIIDKQLVL